MAGYSGTPLVQKLGIKAGFTVAVIDAPKGFDKLLRPLPKGVKPAKSLRGRRWGGPSDKGAGGAIDVMIVFVTSRAALEYWFARSAARVSKRTGAGLWIAWPKKASGVETDLDEDELREVGLGTADAGGLGGGWVDNKVCAIDETWSGLRFVRRKAGADKAPGP